MSPHTLSEGVRGYLAPLAQGALNLLFPPRCAGCDSFGSRFCRSCQAQVEPLLPPICWRCGRPNPPASVCPTCRRSVSDLSSIRSASLLDEPLRSAIHDFKYRGARELAGPLASLLLACWNRSHLSGDALVPVALHQRRRRERGYNQAALLARELGKRLDCPVMEGALRRDRETLPQVGLDARRRRENVTGAFCCTLGAVRELHIMLVDDVCTSGATLEACAAALRGDGQAASVRALTVARARGLDDRTTSATR